MGKSPMLEEKLAALVRLRDEGTSDRAVERLREAISDWSNHLVAAAAQIAGQWQAAPLADDLAEAFARFLANPLKTDKGCKAKAAIAEALQRIGSDREDLFLQGIRHVQMEPAFGGKVDTAAELRGHCAVGLVRMNHPQAMIELAGLLADPEPAARIAAARAIAYSERQAEGVPLLRLKVLTGDADPQVTGECFAALLALAPGSSLPFVAGFLEAADAAVCETAALALGESRLDRAFELLRRACQGARDAAFRRAVLLAIAMLRQDRAVEYLLSVIPAGPRDLAADAVAALATYRGDERIRQRVRQAAQQRRGDDLARVVAAAFETDGH